MPTAHLPSNNHTKAQQKTSPLTRIAVSTLASCPVHSKATLTGIPIAPLTSPTASCPGRTDTVRTRGKSCWANASREEEMSVMTMGAQPAASAQRRVRRPMGPAPLRVSVWCWEASVGMWAMKGLSCGKV